MDPLGTQPAQPNPQTPPISPPAAPIPAPAPVAQQPVAPAPEVQRPEPVTAPVAPDARPVEAWPPAGTPAAQEAAQAPQTVQAPQPVPSQAGPAEAMSIGAETTQATNLDPSAVPTTTSTPGSSPQDMNGFVSPAAQEIRNAAPTIADNPMSDQQADKLFQEEPATKQRNKHKKIKKILVSLIVLILVIAGAGAAYLFIIGNKSAKSYTETSSLKSYKDAFSQIQTSLQKQPVDSAELAAGFNKLKVSSQNSSSLSKLPLGELNPNYKKAKDLSKLESDYRAKALAFQKKYADYTDYVKALSDSFTVVSSLDDLKDIDLTVVTAEKMTTDLGNLLKDCTAASKALEGSTKPSDLSKSSTSLSSSLVRICYESVDSLEDGALVLLAGKTGILNAADQLAMRAYLDTLGNTSSTVASKAADPNADVESLTNYQQALTDSAASLLQEAEAILKG